ncbi:hypothetical protein [Geobacter argillaceus]|uniref:hypothetical protein n=1 Tax=Geobacter argillaceus TaxID=345631 RepID=UPI0011AAE67A|nr:hypothetical protein [Geobacter argillaceus]
MPLTSRSYDQQVATKRSDNHFPTAFHRTACYRYRVPIGIGVTNVDFNFTGIPDPFGIGGGFSFASEDNAVYIVLALFFDVPGIEMVMTEVLA